MNEMRTTPYPGPGITIIPKPKPFEPVALFRGSVDALPYKCHTYQHKPKNGNGKQKP